MTTQGNWSTSPSKKESHASVGAENQLPTRERNGIAVEQVRTALKHFEANAGMVVTTAKKTRELIEAVQKLSTELDKPIDIIAGEDVARFVIENGKDLLFNLKIV